MKLLSLVFSLLLALMLLPQSSGAQTQAQPTAEELAQKSAESWLALTDTGKYAESWEQASSTFRAAITKDQWIAQLSPVRNPLGKVLSRKLNSAQPMTNPPSAPAGEYVILKYSTDFENRKGSTETVAMLLDKDGQWRALGYFIK